jgi:N-ethylmaleimide reductase
VAKYAAAAKNAKEAGFDGAEIHSENGYPLDTFLQSKTNKRTDEYGGSPENRFRILRSVVEGVSGVFSSKQAGVKISPNTN